MPETERAWHGDQGDELAWHFFEQHMRQRRLSPNTVDNYHNTLAPLSLWLAGRSADGLFGATAAQLEEWLLQWTDAKYAAATHFSHHQRATTFYKWASEKEYLDGPSPMAGIAKPETGQRLIPLPDPADLVKVLSTCAKGKTFRDRRDHAIMRVLLEPGTPRAAALATLLDDDVDLRRDKIKITDKGSKEREVPFGALCSHALMLYRRERGKHPKARLLPQFFLGRRGAMTRDGMYQVLAERCEQAGVPVIGPHKWRHFTAHEWFLAGGSEGDAMALFGWSSSAMPHRYAAAAASARAQQHARELSLGDRIRVS